MLELDDGGWRIKTAREERRRRRSSFLATTTSHTPSPSSKNFASRSAKAFGWRVKCKNMLQVSAWRRRGGLCTGRLVVTDEASEREEEVRGVGLCRIRRYCGQIVGENIPRLPAWIEFGEKEDDNVLIWRAEIESCEEPIFLETITMFDGEVTTELSASHAIQQTRTRKMEVLMWTFISLALFPIAFASLKVSRMLLMPLTVLSSLLLASVIPKLQCRYVGMEEVWTSAMLNGWQSFSYAGVIKFSACFGVLGSIRRLLCRLNIFPLQVRQQTGWLFSGPFHDGLPTIYTLLPF